MGQEDPLEKEMATHSNILAWRIPWTGEPGGLQSTGSQRVGHNRAHTRIPSIAGLMQGEEEKMEEVTDFIFLGSKITVDGS